ncbi:MAG: DNA adenine methylase [Candidatus Dormibacteria bacterium]
MIAMGRRRTDYQPPFPYFGGKSAVADIIWEALGDPVNYVEPFFGSGAALFLRPGGAGRVETVNDADGMIANFWNALKYDADAVAEYSDNPVNECLLHARHLWLIGQRERITERLMGDPEFFDTKVAGWWCWGLCCWIGSGWCSGKGPWISKDGVLTRQDDDEVGDGVKRQRPHLGSAGRGVNRKIPHLGSAGQGVKRQRPHLGNAGQGVNRKTGSGDRLTYLKGYLGEFSNRLQDVRVCCGDWSRVCGSSVTFKHGLTGVLLDPPYPDSANRDMRCYAVDCGQVAHDALAWAVEMGKRPDMRIVYCGYEGSQEIPADWREFAWKTPGGYALQGDGDTQGRMNRGRERIWFSPACLKPAQRELLF